MSTSTYHFRVDAPPAAVFGYIVDPDTMMPGFTKLEVLHQTPDGVGTAFRYEERYFGMRFTGLGVFTEYVKDERLKLEFSGALEEGVGVWTFEAADGGTEVTIASDFRLRIPLLGPLAMRLMQRSSQTRWLPFLKKEIEKHARMAEPVA